MKTKTLKRISLVSFAIIVALVLTLALVMLLPSAQPKAQAAAGDFYTAEYQGSNGRVAQPLNRQTLADKYGVDYEEVIALATGQDVYYYLNGLAYNNYKVGYLANDVAIAYDANKDGYYNISGVKSSNAVFSKIFDGNGYTVKIHGGAGTCNSTKEIKDDEGDRYTRRHGAPRYAGMDIWYEYTGYLVAQNYGKIVNMTIDYTSPHTVIEAVNGHNGTGAGDLGIATSNRLMSARGGLFVAGIVTGINGYEGVIDNVRVNINNAFTAIKMASTNSGYFYENTVYAGGIAGRIEDESTISNCWVDIADGAGVFAGAQGKPTNFPNLDNHFSMGIAGGIVGNIDRGSGKINYCVLSGKGQVKGFANRATNKSSSFQAFAGGVTAGCVYIYGEQRVLSGTSSDYDATVKKGQIKGIISSWTGSRFTNKNNSPQASMGTLFDSVGSDEVVESIALLYDLETLMDNNMGSSTYMTKPVSDDGKVVLDASAKSIKSWLAIHPTSAGGTMTVKFDTDHPLYDIRIHILADGHEDFKNSGAMDDVVFNTSSKRYEQFKLNRNQGGGIIWSGTFANANDSSNHINLNLDDPIYAEVYMISSANSGSYNYEFGTMGLLEYEDTNDPDGNYVREYTGAGNPLLLPNVVMTNNLAFDTSVFKNESLWQISRGNVSDVALSQTYMPGTYKMKVQTQLGERVYGYYNEAQRILAWQPTTDYVFTILQGELKFGDATTSTDGWQSSVTFELKMNSKNDFDSVEFQRNGAFPEDSAQGFTPNVNGSVKYTVTAGTGKNGTAYTFYAYKKDAVSGENVLVAVSESRTVRIDKEAPEISEVKYYMVEDGEERLMSEDEVDSLRANVGGKWTKNQVLAKFTVSDNDKSGIASAATESYIHDKELSNNGDREVVVEINDSTPKELLYIDGKGNTSRVEYYIYGDPNPYPLQLNVDRVEGKLSYAGSSYSTEGRFNYSTKNVTIYYRPTFGMSGWQLYYSCKKDSQGQDIWVAADILSGSSGSVKTFTIDWNMGNVSTGIGDDFKIKMINLAGLYEDEVFPLKAGNVPYEDNAVDNFIIWLRIANIYLDYNLNNIYVEGENKSVADILQNEEDKAKYFNKEYDGSEEYDGKKEYKFYADLSDLNNDGFYYTDKLGVIYSPAGMSRPKINVGDNGIVPVELRYTSSEVGEVGLVFSVILQGVDGYNYIVYFTDLSKIDFEEDVEVEEGTYSETCEIRVNITKRKVDVNLGEQAEFDSNKIYYYGDEIPTAIDVLVKETGEYIRVQITTTASATANVGDYVVKGTAPDGFANIEYIVNETTITIEQRHVALDLRYDGGEVGNIPTGVQAGKTHTITATYDDVNGNVVDAKVEYYLEGKLVKVLGARGAYTINVSIADSNYVIDGQTSFKFNIARGYLDITTGVRTKDYTSGNIEYDLIIPEESKELYSDSEIKVEYYEYLDGAVFNQSTNKIDGKIKNAPMTSLPVQRGLYCVRVEFVPKDSENGTFIQKTYADGYLIIVSAQTQVNVENVVLEYSYTAEMFTFNLVDAVAEVRSSSNKQLWSASTAPDGYVKVQYKDATGNYVDVAKTPNDGGGWFAETGRYEYRINYIGNDDYNKSAIDVVMVINKADLKGITFNSVETVYDGKNHLPTVSGLLNYAGLKVTFQQGVKKVYCEGTSANDALKEFELVGAREYTMYMTVEKDGYETKELQAKVVIKKAKMEISAKPLDVTYDGNPHTVEFNGIVYDESRSVYVYNGEDVLISSGNSEGNLYATNVYMEPNVGPSYYTGKVTFTSSNYEDLEVNTFITIRQALLSYTEAKIDLPKKLPSAIDLSEYKGYYIDKASNTKIDCELEYRDKDGNVVALNEDKTLADGRYTVWLVIPDDNFYLDIYWQFEIGEINDASISTIGIVAISVVAALLVGAAITAIVVVKKRKKAGIV